MPCVRSCQEPNVRAHPRTTLVAPLMSEREGRRPAAYGVLVQGTGRRGRQRAGLLRGCQRRCGRRRGRPMSPSRQPVVWPARHPRGGPPPRGRGRGGYPNALPMAGHTHRSSAAATPSRARVGGTPPRTGGLPAVAAVARRGEATGPLYPATPPPPAAFPPPARPAAGSPRLHWRVGICRQPRRTAARRAAACRRVPPRHHNKAKRILYRAARHRRRASRRRVPPGCSAYPAPESAGVPVGLGPHAPLSRVLFPAAHTPLPPGPDSPRPPPPPLRPHARA